MKYLRFVQFMFRKIYIPLIALAICLGHSCTNQRENIPEGVLDESKMVEVLTDIHLAETAFIMNNLKSRSTDSSAASYYKFVFNKHGISSTLFDKSFRYYTSQPAQFSIIYEKVLTEISERQAEQVNK